MQRREMSEAEEVSIREFKSSSFSVEFIKYVEQEKLSFKKLTCNDSRTTRWIFWNPKNGIYEIISLLEIMICMKKSLFQFWSASKVDDGKQLLLTTRGQPFVITIPEDKATFSNGLCLYRTNISLSDYDIKKSIKAEEKEKENDDVGVVGRVFQNQRIEFTPNVSYYSIEEYPQRELALSCKIRSCVAFPLYDSNGHPIGVIEMVSQSELDSMFWTHLQEIISSDYMKKKGLECMRICKGLCVHHGAEDALISNTTLEIDEVMKVFNTSHDLILAQTWVLCKSCNVLSVVGSDCGLGSFLKSGFNCQNNFIRAQRFCNLRKGEGVVGTALFHGLVYCENVSEFNICEYPLAHFARHDNLSACFAVCLRSTLTENQVYVLEFFLRPRNFNDVKTTLVSILESLMQKYPTFKVVSRDEVGDNLSDVDDERFFSYKNKTLEMRMDSIENSKQDIAIVLLENQNCNKAETQGDNRKRKSPIGVIDSEFLLQPISEADAVYTKNLVLANSKECFINSSNLPSRKGGIPISLEELQNVSGMKRKEAAEKLNVSVSTLKRVCREYDISRWPPRKTIIDNQPPDESAFSKEVKSGCAPTFIQDESHLIVKPKIGCASPIIKDERNVTVKAKYGENFIKFELSACSGIDEFNQQVFKRLKLDVGTYIVKYQDEDNDWILIACDEDLWYYISSSIASGKNTLVLLIESIA